MKILVNRCFGGFGLSDKAYERLIELGIPVKKYESPGRDPKTGLYKNGASERVIYDRDLDDEESPFKGAMRTLAGRYWETFIDDYGDGRIGRTDPLIIQVVEELGDEANGRFSELEVVEIPDGIEWEIDEYDGSETVREKHRSW